MRKRPKNVNHISRKSPNLSFLIRVYTAKIYSNTNVKY